MQKERMACITIVKSGYCHKAIILCPIMVRIAPVVVHFATVAVVDAELAVPHCDSKTGGAEKW
jgi:hypothetical protein